MHRLKHKSPDLQASPPSLGYFPKSFKHAIMIFIPKGTLSQHRVQNDRPISLLKIQDKILNTRLSHHLTLHDLRN